jgi:5-(carboxyamino)imidazole ribonucleotide synthase
VPAIVEGWVKFERELSLIAVRGAAGAEAYYPLTENVHRDGILVSSIAPYGDSWLQRTAEQWLREIMARFDYRGVLTVEFFLTPAGLVANEIAPRVHNSGHWTIEGAETSQFENHLRAVLGWPLGATGVRGHAAMLNFLGRIPDSAAILAIPGAHLHDYGKEPRPGRKVGHCTLLDPARDRLLARIALLRAAIERGD